LHMSAAGIPQGHIAAAVRSGISEPTLRSHFRAELDLARDQTTALAVGKLVRAIERCEAWAICFWLKCRAGWQERRQMEVSAEVSLVEILRRRQAKQLPASAAETTVNLEILPDDKRV